MSNSTNTLGRVKVRGVMGESRGALFFPVHKLRGSSH